MHGYIKPITEVALTEVARNFSKTLSRPKNGDIDLDFPSAIDRFGGEPAYVRAHLQAVAEEHTPGEREHFIVFAGSHAVGMSSVALLDHKAPEGIEPSWPYMSGFIAHPWRQQGLGRISLLQRLDIIKAHYDSHAWTKVRAADRASEGVVTSTGFTPLQHTAQSEASHTLFIYSDR